MIWEFCKLSLSRCCYTEGKKDNPLKRANWEMRCTYGGLSYKWIGLVCLQGKAPPLAG